MSQARFQKQQRERARREKAAAKRERKAARADETSPAEGDDQVASQPEPRVLEELAVLHQQFEDGALDFEAFEDRKRDLLAQLDV